MQSKPQQITANFATETQFEVETKSTNRTFNLPELLVLPLEEQPIHVYPNLQNRRGIPFSAIHD